VGEWKDCDRILWLPAKRMPVSFAVSHYQELGLIGIAIRSKRQIGAMSQFEGLNKTRHWHFEKGMADCKGIYRAVNAERQRFLARDYTYIKPVRRYGCGGNPGGEDALPSPSHVEVHLLQEGRSGEVGFEGFGFS